MTAVPSVGPAWLFCPAHRPERFEKAWASGASAVILDLEDGVPDTLKEQARNSATAWLRTVEGLLAQPLPAIRINALRSREALLDLSTLLRLDGLPRKGMLLVPKADSVGELLWLEAQLAHALPAWQLCALIESTRGLHSMGEMLRECTSLAAVGFGAADFAAEIGVAMDSPTLHQARRSFVLESAACPVMRLDVPTLALDDDEPLRRDCWVARTEGFHGKFAIHPRQVKAILHAFAPAEAELQWARRVLHAHQSAGGGAIQVDGQMVDTPLVDRARAVLALLPT
jgi:citrate lyase beta subunit